MEVKKFCVDSKDQRPEMMVMSETDEIRHRERVRPYILECSTMKIRKGIGGEVYSSQCYCNCKK